MKRCILCTQARFSHAGSHIWLSAREQPTGLHVTESGKQVLSVQNTPIHFIISISFSVWVI